MAGINPENAPQFSATAFFAETLHKALNASWYYVSAWGGSKVEAWTNREY